MEFASYETGTLADGVTVRKQILIKLPLMPE
jgi:hypothetical protein